MTIAAEDDKPQIADLVEAPAEHRTDEPPVVARLVVEIRSDGSRTIARGAMEDVASGQTAAVEAQGTTPLSLAFALAKSMVAIPRFARRAGRGLLSGRRKKG